MSAAAAIRFANRSAKNKKGMIINHDKSNVSLRNQTRGYKNVPISKST